MAQAITEKRFKEFKHYARTTTGSVAEKAKIAGCSVTTMRRVMASKTYADFKLKLIEDRGPKYTERRLKSSTGSTQKKQGLWTRFLHFFDIKV